MERVSQLAGAFLTFALEIWIYLADRSLGAAPGLGELRCQAQNFVAARSTTLRIPVGCSRLRRSHVLPRSQCLDAIYESPGTHFGHLVHQTFKNENT
jgi:hypothetical protein